MSTYFIHSLLLHVALLQLFTNFIKFHLWLISAKGNEGAAEAREGTNILSAHIQTYVHKHVHTYVNKFMSIQNNIL